ncbi:MAG: D-alanyl-D-alanine carboxypeptidase [Flavobacteriales bacterium]|nr:D-alanyl-D-alanine carboxypeptidase [Flavobacteriales bacterium]|tara:strand:- start:519 stop:1298 length:780 start_codon:yes stop_codon:yes gene_type:complete
MKKHSYIKIFLYIILFLSCNEANTHKNIKTNLHQHNINTSKTEMINLINLLTGKFEPSDHKNFTLVDPKYHTKSKMFLQKETLDAFINMRNAAQKEGINLRIVSGTRNFTDQQKIWDKKYKRFSKSISQPKDIINKIMIWSSMPGTSRHHWGTDIDINGFDEYFNGENQQAIKDYNWLNKNADKFGFCQVYSEKDGINRRFGYNEEKWHWSYMPIASKYLKDYKKYINYNHLTKFLGSEHAKEMDIFNQYVFSISKKCQ